MPVAMTANVNELIDYFSEQEKSIEAWLQEQFMHTPPVITTSVDLRNAGYKLAPVDTNLFPAGFNNLCPEEIDRGAIALKNMIKQYWPQFKKILLIPENQSRNPYYWENMANLKEMVDCAGYEVHVGYLLPELTAPKTLDLPSKRHLTLEPIQREGNRITVDGFSPDMIILNNDLASGVPSVLQGIEQVIQPTSQLGWCSRLKSQHFLYYQKICQQFAKHIDIDPWLISPLFESCGMVDFSTGEGEECIFEYAQNMMAQLQEKYAEYDIEEKPFIVVKADMGTYGMGVMMLEDPAQIRELSRKQRNRMLKTKESQKLNKVIIQEGIPTIDRQQNMTAERVMYLIAGQCIGGFFRMHPQKSATDNLNTPGMQFVAFTVEQSSHELYAYTVVSRLAALAAAHELASLEKSK